MKRGSQIIQVVKRSLSVQLVRSFLEPAYLGEMNCSVIHTREIKSPPFPVCLKHLPTGQVKNIVTIQYSKPEAKK